MTGVDEKDLREREREREAVEERKQNCPHRSVLGRTFPQVTRGPEKRGKQNLTDTKANIMFCFFLFLLSGIFPFPLVFSYYEQELHV